MGRPKKHTDPSDQEMVPIKEGLAHILVPKSASTQMDPKKAKDDPHQKQSVFYNPIQQFNRDLSVLAIKAFGLDLTYVRRKAHESSTRHTKKSVKYVGRNWKAAQKKAEAEATKRTVDENGVDRLEADGPSKRQKTNGSNFFETEARDAAEFSEQFEQRFGQEQQSHEVLEAGGMTAPKDPDEVPLLGTMLEQHADPPAEAPSEDASLFHEHGNEEQMHTQNETQPPAAPDQPAPPETAYAPPFTIFDALSATGLRALRYGHEIPFATSISACDLSPSATAQIAANVAHNDLGSRIRVLTGNAQAHMYSLCSSPSASNSTPRTPSSGPNGPTKYDVIDLDPYGTAAPFLDAAIQAISDNGLLAVTCTDAGVWASNGYPEKCFALYGGTPLKGLHSHEAGLRLILHAIAQSAARYGVAIEPLLSLSIDFYARVFVRVRKSPAEVKLLAGRTMSVYNCDSGCGAWYTQPLARHEPYLSKDGTKLFKHSFAQAPTTGPWCECCGMKTHLAGPMWGGPIHNVAFIRSVLDLAAHSDADTYATKERVQGMLTTALEEVVLLDPDLRNPPATDATASANATPDPTTSTTPFLDPTLAAPSPPPPTKHHDPARPVPPSPPHPLDRAPFFLSPAALAKVLHCQAPAESLVKGALRHLGYGAARSHTKPGTIKTDAPWPVLWHVMREWVRQRAPLKDGALRPGTAGWGLYHAADADGDGADAVKRRDARARIAALPVVFDDKLGREPEARGVMRYQVNPRANWGPMGRARGR